MPSTATPGRELVPDTRAEHLALLGAEERAVLDQMLAGKSSREIADLLSLSSRTIDLHCERILQKVGMRNKAELMRVCLARPAIARRITD